MTSDPPTDRQNRPLGQGRRDRIFVRDFLWDAEIGAYQRERGVTQRLRFDIVLDVVPPDDSEDDVDTILSYETLVEAVKTVLAAERLVLLETLAERIAGRLLAEPRAERVHIRIGKLDRGPFVLGVEIQRDRKTLPKTAPAAPEIEARTLVVLLSNAAIADPRLPVWLDQLDAMGRPLGLVVGMPEAPPPRASQDMPQWRIDLLALEQNAWTLAARDRRCLVVDSRAELDAVIRDGGLAVWAPPRMVLGTVPRPQLDPRNAGELATWFGTQIRATALLGLGTPVPGGATVPLEDHLALPADDRGQ